MGSVPSGRLSWCARAVRSWPIWELPRWLIGYVVGIVLVDAVAIVAAGRYLPSVSAGRLILFGLLLAGSAVTVELTRRAGENAGVVKDVYAIWELPAAILLPVVFALIAPIFRIALTQWRVRQIPTYRRVFTAAAIGLSYGAAALIFHAIAGSGSPVLGGPTGAPRWVLAVAVAGAAQWAVNQAVVLLAVKGADPTASIPDLVLNRENRHNDVTEMSAAVLATVGIAASPFTVILALPLVTVLQRSSRHAQLVNDSRIDSKTGLLNARAWHSEASAEVTRARRTGTPLAVALIDLDRFKSVNDTYGHLSGDRALISVTESLKMLLREYDLAGRFGGDELAVLLPQTGGREARQVLERIRSHVARTPIDGESGDAGSTSFSLTISAGVAALSGTSSTLTELLAAADSALYRAKRAGRNQVWMLTDTATFGAGDDADRRRRAAVERV